MFVPLTANQIARKKFIEEAKLRAKSTPRPKPLTVDQINELKVKAQIEKERLEDEKLKKVIKSLRCIISSHKSLLKNEPDLPYLLKKRFYHVMDNQLQKAISDQNGLDDVLGPIINLLAPPKQLFSSISENPNYYSYLKKKIPVLKLLPGYISENAIKRFRIKPDTIEEIIEADGFWLENDGVAYAKKLFGDDYVQPMNLLNNYIKKIQTTYIGKYGRIQESQFIPAIHKINISLDTFLHPKRNLDSQGIHFKMAQLYVKRINKHYKKSIDHPNFFPSADDFISSAIWITFKNQTDPNTSIDQLIPQKVRYVPKSFADSVKSKTSFALCLVHLLDMDVMNSIYSSFHEVIQGGHTILAIIANTDFYLVEDYYKMSVKFIPDAILKKCGLTNTAQYNAKVIGSETQEIMELKDENLGEFHKAIMIERFAIPIEFTFLGHKLNRDFYGYCGTIALFVAEFIIQCYIANKKNKLKKFDITAQVSLVLEAYNPCYVYNYIRMWARCMEKDLSLANSNQTGGMKMIGGNISPEDLMKDYRQFMEQVQQEKINIPLIQLDVNFQNKNMATGYNNKKINVQTGGYNKQFPKLSQ
jgi:hypothetical protein